MGRSLFFKLLGAFALVIVVLAVVATVLANQATAGEFRTYTDRNGQVWAQYLAPALAQYYSQNNTWNGVTDVVQDPMILSSSVEPTTSFAIPFNTSPPQPQTFPSPTPEMAVESPGMGNNGMGPRMGRGMMGMGSNTNPTSISDPAQSRAEAVGDGAANQFSRGGMGGGMRGMQGTGVSTNTGMWSMMGHRVIIADASGQVVSDSSGETNGALLSSEQLAGGQSIQVAGQPAGTVLVDTAETLPGTPAGEFLGAMNRSMILAVLTAGTVAMLLGGVLFFQITAPVRKLKAAASAIAAGDLSQRVQVHSQDELGDLAITFNHMAESLSRAETQRRQMVADVAHELRTPLSVMQANLEAMQDGVLPLDGEEIASLHEETVLLGRLVADLHLLSVAEAGQLKLEREEVEPGELIRKSAERLVHSAQERGVTLNIETQPSLPSVLADADRISQVIGNLVSNALRYTGVDGAVTVNVNALAAKTAASAAQRAPEVVVTITDTGCGIPETDLPHIFDRFYRADKSRTRTKGGSGLGLAIVKHIVEAHGGRIWAESPVWSAPQSQSRGTRISFTIPAVKAG